MIHSRFYNQLINRALFLNNFFIAFFQGSYIYSMGMRSNVLCYQQACKTCHKYKHCLRKHSQTRLREVETTVKRSTSRTIPVESFMNWTVLGIICSLVPFLQLSQVKRTPQDSIDELFIWMINPSFINYRNQSNLNAHSCMCNKQWIFCFNLSVFCLIEKSLNG